MKTNTGPQAQLSTDTNNPKSPAAPLPAMACRNPQGCTSREHTEVKADDAPPETHHYQCIKCGFKVRIPPREASPTRF
jgi:hypothetical protein